MKNSQKKKIQKQIRTILKMGVGGENPNANGLPTIESVPPKGESAKRREVFRQKGESAKKGEKEVRQKASECEPKGTNEVFRQKWQEKHTHKMKHPHEVRDEIAKGTPFLAGVAP